MTEPPRPDADAQPEGPEPPGEPSDAGPPEGGPAAPEPAPPEETAEAPAGTAEAPAETAEAPAETAEAPAETAEATPPAETAEATALARAAEALAEAAGAAAVSAAPDDRPAAAGAAAAASAAGWMGAGPGTDSEAAERRVPRRTQRVALDLSASGSRRIKRLLWGTLLAVAVVGVILLADVVRSVTVPLLIAYAIAYVLDPVVDRFEARGHDRTRAIMLLLGVFFVLGLAASLLVVPQILRELAEMPGKVREVLGQLLPWIEATLDVQLPDNVHEALAAIRNELRVDTVEDVKKLAGPLSTIALTVSGGTKNFFASLGGLTMIPFFAFYLLRDFDEITARAEQLVPRRYRDEVVGRAREIDQAMSSFVRGQLTVASILALIYAVGLSILGVPLGLVVGLLAGFGNLVPFLGTAIGVVLATLMVLLDWHGFGTLVAVYGVFAFGQTLEGWVLTPRIVGESVGLSPFAVIIAVLVFGELFGFFGLLIAVPLAASLKIVLRVAVESYKTSDFYELGVDF